MRISDRGKAASVLLGTKPPILGVFGGLVGGETSFGFREGSTS